MIRLGPISVKIGQALSTRRDILRADFADELATLQDKVPPLDSKTAIALIEKELGGSISDYFTTFDDEPLASASLAQVHSATLDSGEEVVIKVLRPDVEETIFADLRLMKKASKFLERHFPIARQLHVCEVVDHYERTILDELDLELEGLSTTRLRNNFTHSPLLYVPRVYHHLSRKRILVMEKIKGVPISAIDELQENGTDLALLAKRGVETFFTQVFQHNYFHADMHPGNIFVDISVPNNPSYMAVDCAIMGTLSEEDQTFLARNLVAFFDRDYGEIARLHVEFGWIPHEGDTEEFEQVIREACEPFFEQPLSEISFGLLLLKWFNAARRFHMEVQPQLVLLQKTLLNIEGLGRQLDPNLDLWATAKPFMERWMKEKYGISSTITAILDNAPKLVLEIALLPELLVTARRTIQRLEHKTSYQSKQLEEFIELRKNAKKRRVIRRVFGWAMVLFIVPYTIFTDFPSDVTLYSAIYFTVAVSGVVLVLSS